jgi:type IV secretion system protein VirB11
MTISTIQSISVKNRAIEKLKRDLGEMLLNAILDPKTLDVMCNPDGKIWVDSIGNPMQCIGSISPARAISIITTVSAFHDKEVTKNKPLLETTLPLNGERFTAQMEPAVVNPTFNIRTKASVIIPLEDYVKKRIMTPEQFNQVLKAIKEHKNILIVGSTGSGKTTFVNAIIDGMVKQYPHERIIIIEDTGEIQCKAENSVKYLSSPEIDTTQIIKTTLRMRPDRVLVGEVRGSEALDLLDVWNTGHEGGVATLHANDALSGLTRLKSLISRNPCAPKEIEPLIAEVVHCVIHIEKTPMGRRISDILFINGFKNNQYLTNKNI